MNDTKFYGIDFNTKEGEIAVYNMACNDMADISSQMLTLRSIYYAYDDCELCYTLFKFFEIFEDYHEAIVTMPCMKLFKIAVCKQLDNVISQISTNKDTICNCKEQATVDYIDDDGKINLIDDVTNGSLFNHYDHIVTNPYYLNQARGIRFNDIRDHEVLEDNHLAIIFNDEDKPITYNKEKETIYNTRRHYRLMNRNFLKMQIHSIFTEDEQTLEEAIVYRDMDMVIQEAKMWREYFRKPHAVVTAAIITLQKIGFLNDCIYDVVKFL